MTLGVKWAGNGPVVTKSNICESCGQGFPCELSLAGCWCSKVNLTDQARKELREKYTGCLCPTCLGRYATDSL